MKNYQNKSKTGEITEREMTAEEITQMEAMQQIEPRVHGTLDKGPIPNNKNRSKFNTK